MYSIKIIVQCTLVVFTSWKMYMYKFLLFISVQKGDNK